MERKGAPPDEGVRYEIQLPAAPPGMEYGDVQRESILIIIMLRYAGSLLCQTPMPLLIVQHRTGHLSEHHDRILGNFFGLVELSGCLPPLNQDSLNPKQIRMETAGVPDIDRNPLPGLGETPELDMAAVVAWRIAVFITLREGAAQIRLRKITLVTVIDDPKECCAFDGVWKSCWTKPVINNLTISNPFPGSASAKIALTTILHQLKDCIAKRLLVGCRWLE